MKQVLDPRDLYRALSELARRYQFRNRDEVCCYGLTVSQCYALETLDREGLRTTSELAERLGLDLSTTTRIVDQLVRKRLAERRRADDDGRVKEVTLTDAGLRLVARVEEDLSGMLAGALSGVRADVLVELPAVVRRIASALSCGCVTPRPAEPALRAAKR